MSIQDARVVVVTGKGGVGKTTITAALALKQAQMGRRVLVAEVGGASRICALFGQANGSYEPIELVPGLHAISLTPQEAIEDFVVLRLKLRSVFRMVFDNRVMRPFLAAVPGLHDLIQLGKLYFEEDRTNPDGTPTWDQIFLDAPATGHGITMLQSPNSMMDLTHSGPFHENARVVHKLFSDPERTALVVAALPEDLVVNETLDLAEQLGDLRDQLALCVLNEVQPHHESVDAIESVRGHLEGRGFDEALDLAEAEALRSDAQEQAYTRLVEGLACPVLELPLLQKRELGPPELQRLAQCLESGE